MPFTIAHPALVIPLSRTKKRFSLTGLVIGSMTPDIEFFIQMREVENIGHHLNGILIFDLPVAICLSFLFHNVFRNSFLENLPNPYKRRFIEARTFNWNQYFMKHKGKVLFSFFVGILTHLAWDGFTHFDGFVVSSLPFLSEPLHMLGQELPVYFWLQIIFSIAGMVIVHFQIMQMPSQLMEHESKKMDGRYWVLFGALISIILLMRLILWPQYNSFGGIMIAGMGSILYSWPLVSLIFHNKFSPLKTKS